MNRSGFPTERDKDFGRRLPCKHSDAVERRSVTRRLGSMLFAASLTAIALFTSPALVAGDEVDEIAHTSFVVFRNRKLSRFRWVCPSSSSPPTST